MARLADRDSRPPASVGGSSARAPTLIAGRYRCLRTLGSGGMADVFEAVDQIQGRRVALKLLRTEEGERADSALRTSL
ncbi:MAG: hypothetical protein RL033_7425, partial [Pseudomonadota bacterium]